MGKIEDSLDAAFTNAVSKPMPKSIGARVRFLLSKEKTDNPAEAARLLGEKLGCHQRTVERYRDDQVKKPKPDTAGKIEDLTRKLWQPKVRADRAKKAATSAGIRVSLRARFGFTAAPGTTNDARQRRITRTLPPEYAEALFNARQAGASEDDLGQILADGLAEVYFTDGGTRAAGLAVTLDDLDYLTLQY
ncbi:telomere-protecting terminal protein Tpg [Streptomyces sp. RKAG337]|uniref:telomere-protecting terminal protein Tpg n=1 Tax=Streptomyces sp. RKAG337 TaxID=2893404 RepID=UPI0020348FEE|nr:terminal protein TpgA1 [Streptomyces sp. RKAG337]MCM2430980.1 terminal protein TpgA1 [Streptomyces sp. RKAG337]